jgi:hypothetical protein
MKQMQMGDLFGIFITLVGLALLMLIVAWTLVDQRRSRR